MTALSTSYQSGSESTSSPAWGSRPAAPVPSDTEVARLGVVRDQRVGGLLGCQLELLGQLHADPLPPEQAHHRGPVLQVRAGRVAERVAAAPVSDAQDAVEGVRVIA